MYQTWILWEIIKKKMTHILGNDKNQFNLISGGCTCCVSRCKFNNNSVIGTSIGNEQESKICNYTSADK